MNTAEVLERAAEVIVERGWWQDGGQEYGEEAGTCAWLAIELVGEWPDTIDIAPTLGKFLGLPGRDGNWLNEIYRWNDTRKSADEVITALRDCATAERAKQATP